LTGRNKEDVELGLGGDKQKKLQVRNKTIVGLHEWPPWEMAHTETHRKAVEGLEAQHQGHQERSRLEVSQWAKGRLV